MGVVTTSLIYLQLFSPRLGTGRLETSYTRARILKFVAPNDPRASFVQYCNLSLVLYVSELQSPPTSVNITANARVGEALLCNCKHAHSQRLYTLNSSGTRGHATCSRPAPFGQLFAVVVHRLRCGVVDPSERKEFQRCRRNLQGNSLVQGVHGGVLNERPNLCRSRGGTR